MLNQTAQALSQIQEADPTLGKLLEAELALEALAKYHSDKYRNAANQVLTEALGEQYKDDVQRIEDINQANVHLRWILILAFAAAIFSGISSESIHQNNTAIFVIIGSIILVMLKLFSMEVFTPKKKVMRAYVKRANRIGRQLNFPQEKLQIIRGEIAYLSKEILFNEFLGGHPNLDHNIGYYTANIIKLIQEGVNGEE